MKQNKQVDQHGWEKDESPFLDALIQLTQWVLTPIFVAALLVALLATLSGCVSQSVQEDKCCSLQDSKESTMDGDAVKQE